jgi:hypothetical protein
MKIEKGVEIPNIGGRGAYGGGKWQKIARLMEVDDSVFFAGKNIEYMALARAMKGMGFKPLTRWVGDGHRVWRIE